MVEAQIGQLNGKWSLLFRALLVLISIFILPIIGLITWLVVGQFEMKAEIRLMTAKQDFFMSAGPRYTAEDAEHDISNSYNKFMREIEQKYPPAWFREQVDSYGRRIESLEKKP